MTSTDEKKGWVAGIIDTAYMTDDKQGKNHIGLKSTHSWLLEIIHEILNEEGIKHSFERKMKNQSNNMGTKTQQKISINSQKAIEKYFEIFPSERAYFENGRIKFRYDE